MFGLAHLIVEARLKFMLLEKRPGEALPQSIARPWEWYTDPGFNGFISVNFECPKPPVQKRCKFVVSFRGMLFRKSAEKLEPFALYESRSVNFKTGEFFTYEVSGDGRREINLYQTTTKPLPYHPFTTASIESHFDAFKLYDDVNKDIDINIICFVNMANDKPVRGLKFTGLNTTLTGFITTSFTLEDLQYYGSPMWKRVHGFVVRCGVYEHDHLDEVGGTCFV